MIDSIAQTLSGTRGPGGVLIGMDTGAGNLFNGTIDEVAIYNRALSSAEIQSHYLAKFGITNPNSYAAKVLLSGPSNYWGLNETSGTTAVDIVGVANGTISGGVVLNGESGMTFNGTTGKVLTSGNIPVPVIKTVEGWIKFPNADNYYPMLSTRHPVNPGSFFVGSSATGGRTAVYGPGINDVIGNKLICDNQWHHIVYIFTPPDITIYIDGVFDRAGVGSIVTPAAVNQPVGIAFDNAAPGYYTNGSIDEVAIYPRALTAQEILEHYQAR